MTCVEFQKVMPNDCIPQFRPAWLRSQERIV
jgi:hypothetical protein